MRNPPPWPLAGCDKLAAAMHFARAFAWLLLCLPATLAEIWGTPITIENKVGAGGTIGAEATAKAAPDGYSLVLCNVGSHGIGPAFYHRKLGYDALKDVTYIGMIGMTPNVMAVHPSVPATTVAEFVAYAKANPGKLSYGSSGVGTSP